MNIKLLLSMALSTSLCACNSNKALDALTITSKDPDWATAENTEKTIKKTVIVDYVMYQFKNNYPDAQKVTWEQEVDSYTVKFWNNKLPAEICYSDRAVVISERIGQNINSLSPKIAKHLSQNYPKQKVQAVYRNFANKLRSMSVVLDNQSELFYELSGGFLREEKP